jgi:hypothetical protein
MGGAIFNLYGTVSIDNSTLTGNTAAGGDRGPGGGGYGTPGSAYGGAVLNLDGTVNVSDSTIANNTVTDDGGGATSGGSDGVYSPTLSRPEAASATPGVEHDGSAIYNLSFGLTPSGGAVAAIVHIVDSILAGDPRFGNALGNNQVAGTAEVISAGANFVQSYHALGGAALTGSQFLPVGIGGLRHRRAPLARRAATRTRLTARLAGAGHHRTLVLVVRVRGRAAQAKGARGLVQLRVGRDVLSTAPLVGGRATFRLPSLISTRRLRKIRAVFDGYVLDKDGADLVSSSAASMPSKLPRHSAS